MQAYVDLVVCAYARVLQKLHEERITSPGPEVDSKFYKAMEDCVAFRARPDVVPYIAPGAPCAADTPAGVAVFPFDPGERVSYLTGGVRSSFPFDPGG